MASYPRGHQLPNATTPVRLSAGTAELLRHEAAALLSYATSHPDVTPQAIAEMLFRTRTARPHRALAMVVNRGELLDALQAIIEDREHHDVVHTGTPAGVRRVGFVFPGQGSQRPGMGRMFYDACPAFRDEADRCAEAFGAETGMAPLDYLLDDDYSGPDTATSVQPALFTQMSGLAAMWRSFGIDPKATVGHSQGEIAAAYVAGTITLADAVRVVGIRARAADEFVPGDYGMAVVAAGRDRCEDLLARCPGWAELSVVNSPSLTAISGERLAVHDIVDTLAEHGTFARVIDVGYPAHTSLINQLADTLRADLRGQLQNPAFLDTDTVCVGTTLGGPITAELPPDEYWFWNLRNTVRFDKAIVAATALGVDTFVELAEHPTLQLAIEEDLAENLAGNAALVLGTSHRKVADLNDFTRNLALLAVHDLDYRWDLLGRQTSGPPPLPLADFPNTAMNEVVLWLPYDGGPAQQADPKPVAGSPRLLFEDWVRLPQRSLTPPGAIGIVAVEEADSDLAAALCGAAGDIGATARVIENGATTADLDTYVILARQSPELDDDAAAAAVSAFFSDRTWWPGRADTVTVCWLVTVGGETVVADDAPPDPVHAGLGAGFRCIGAEHPGVTFRHLDLPPGPVSAATILSALHTRDEPELALRDDGLYAKRIVEESPVADTDAAPPHHVLIVGGTGNLGLEFCEHFAHRGAQRITLISRSGETAQVADRLATSPQINAVACDVGDQEAVSRLAVQHRETPADLIIHTALAYSDMELADITAEKADDVMRAKVVGIGRVLNTFPQTGDCRVVLCSSAAATIGGRGQIIYAAANRMLDAMAHRLRTEGCDCVSVQWGQWTVHFDLDSAGWTKLAATGLLPMQPADAIALGMTQFRRNVIVAAFDLARAQPVLAAYGYGPLLSQLPDTATPVATRVQGTDLEQRLTSLLAGTIGVDGTEEIDTAAPMVAIGLDSLQALEFRRRVKTELDHDLDVAELLGGASIADVAVQLSA